MILRLEMFLLADDASVDERGKLNLRGGNITHATPAELPFTLPTLAAVAFLTVDPEGEPITHTLRLDAIAPSGRPLASTGEAELPEDLLRGRAHEGERYGFYIVFNFGSVTLAEYGSYRFVLSVDGDEKDTRVLAVRPAGEEGGRPKTTGFVAI